MLVNIKLKKRHPNNYMQIGRHVVTYKSQEFKLNELELLELNNKCGQVWFDYSVVKKDSPVKKKVSKKVSKKRTEK